MRKLDTRTIILASHKEGKVREIRDLIGMSQWDFVERLNATARSLGLEPKYKYYSVSRIEAHGSVTFEDAMVYAALDPERRGYEWFATGRAHGAQKAEPALFRKTANSRKK